MKRLSVLLSILLAIGISPLPGLAHGVIEGSGKVVVEPRNIGDGDGADFDRLRLSGVGKLILEQGKSVSLTVEAEDNILPYIRTVVGDGVLTLSIENGDADAIRPTKPILYRLTLDDVEGIEITGAGSVQARDIHLEVLDLIVGGSGRVEMASLTADRLTVTVSGAGSVKVSGAVTAQDVSLSGAGAYHAPGLKSREAAVTIQGAGDASVWAEDDLRIVISGAGDVRYRGAPSVSQTITGVGRVTSAAAP